MKDAADLARDGQAEHARGNGSSEAAKDAKPEGLKRPLLLVEYQGRAATVLMSRRPSAAGLIHIQYEDGGGDQEVPAGDCTLNRLIER